MKFRPREESVAPRQHIHLCQTSERVWDIDLDENAYEELRDYFRWFDPRHQHENEVFENLGCIDIQHLVPRIPADMLLNVGLVDTICPPSTQFAAYNKVEAQN